MASYDVARAISPRPYRQGYTENGEHGWPDSYLEGMSEAQRVVPG